MSDWRSTYEQSILTRFQRFFSIRLYTQGGSCRFAAAFALGYWLTRFQR